MTTTVDRKTQTIYDVYDYCGKYDSFNNLNDARVCFRKIKDKYGAGSIVKRVYETTTIFTEKVIQGV